MLNAGSRRRRPTRATRAGQNAQAAARRSAATWSCSTASPATSACRSARTTPTSPSRLPAERHAASCKLRREGDGWAWRERGRSLALEEKHQIANFADFCNECGNCDVFCPEDGGPYVVKPRFFGSEADWRRVGPTATASIVARARPRATVMLGRFEGTRVPSGRGCQRDGVSRGDGFDLRWTPERTRPSRMETGTRGDRPDTRLPHGLASPRRARRQ